jgi:hypothetical protein
VTNIDITDLSQQNAYKIIVNFKIKEYDSAASVEIILRRLR